MSLELNRTIKGLFTDNPDTSKAFIDCQKSAIKVAEELIKQGEVCAWVEKLGALAWVAPYFGRLELFTSADLRSNTQPADIQADMVSEYEADKDGFDEVTQAFEQWLANPVFEDNGAYAKGCMAIAHSEAWLKAYEQLKACGWSENGAGVITNPGTLTTWYGWNAIIEWHMTQTQEKPTVSSYSINVSENGKFLFRTDEQPGTDTDPDVQKVVAAIAKRFPKSEGYKVELILWPTHAGTMKDISQ